MTAAVVSAVLGAVVGSFLNACIYRMPRDIKLSNPPRSFCPSCHKLIPWYENLPAISWIFLRGRCSGCHARISWRYVFVELLTASAFVVTWQKFQWPLAPVYWILVALLIVATFIDLEYFIIPDEVTWGGTICGVLLSFVMPQMMNVSSHLVSGALSLLGAALGFGLLWLVVEGGKLAFGKKKHVFNPPEEFVWSRNGDRADIRIGKESLAWEDVFSRPSDVLVLKVDGLVHIGDHDVLTNQVQFYYDRLLTGDEKLSLDNLDCITGRLRSIVIPREAMGFGDVKFIACLGAFLGWQAVLFILFASSIIGSIAGLAGIFLAKNKAGARIPFGPFLALGAVIWLFGGRELVTWYFSQFQSALFNSTF